MAYIGRSVDVGMFEKQVLTADSSTTTFTLTFAVGSANSLLVVYGGVIQEPAVAYSVSGGGQQIVFSEAPITGTTTYIIYLGKQLTTPRAAGQETTKQTFAGDGSTTLFTLTDPPVVPAGIMVFVDGILQREGSGNNYVSGGSTISFTAAPDSSAEIDVYTLVKEKVSIDTVADGSITRAKMAATFPYWTAGGNFGIGAATPTSKLHIADDGDTALTIQSITGSGQSPSIRLQRGTYGTDGFNDVRIYNTTGGLYVDNINASNEATNLLTATTTGLGIGTSSPSEKLEVYGTTPIFQINDRGLYQAQFGLIGNDLEIRGSSGVIEFYTGAADGASSTLKATLDSVGNLGLGVIPSANQYGKNLQINQTILNDDNIDSNHLAKNAYYNSGWKYYSTGYASKYTQSLSIHSWSIAASGTVNNAISFTQAMTLDASGSLGVGITSPSTLAKIATASTVTLAGDNTYGISVSDATTLAKRMVLGYFATGGTGNYGYGVIQCVNTGTSWTDLVLQPNGGRVAICGNVTAVTGGSGGTVFASAGAYGVTRLLFSSNNTATVAMLSFDNPNGNVGSVGTSGSNAYYATTSDYRLKKNIVPMNGALDKVAILKPCTYTWKSNNEDSQGFIAHELAEVCPQAVIGEKDAVDTEGNPVYQSIDTSFLVATLTAAIQELKAIVDAQAVEIAALKAK